MRTWCPPLLRGSAVPYGKLTGARHGPYIVASPGPQRHPARQTEHLSLQSQWSQPLSHIDRSTNRHAGARVRRLLSVPYTQQRTTIGGAPYAD